MATNTVLLQERDSSLLTKNERVDSVDQCTSDLDLHSPQKLLVSSTVRKELTLYQTKEL